MGMEYKRIDELTTVVTGGTPSTAVSEYWENGSIPWLQSGCCQNCDVNSTEKYITQLGLDNSSARMMPIDTVMIALTGATAGKIGYLNFEACGNQSITGIFPCEELNQRFLYYYLISLRPKILSDCVGGAQAHISQGYVKNIRVPVFSLEKQSKIAECLNKAQSIIDYRQKQLQSLDDLIKARFVEMFGEPIANPLSWPVKRLKELSILITNGNTPKGGSENYVDDGIIFLRSQNVWRNRIDLSDVAYIDETTHVSMKKSSVHHNDILITKTGRINTENSSLGRAALYTGADDSANINGHVYLVRLMDGINPRFVVTILTGEAYRKYIRKVCVGGIDKRQINLDQVEDFPIIQPPIDEQIKFAYFAEQIDKAKAAVQKALDEAQLLFASLMQQYFG